ncbi:MAG TPA: hypothetical protein VLT47_00020, partial [Anaeromyxobacteraceae bacterium]|nr:hypothetical protein [Anaeromyxobacteraceae bacterium]
MAALLMASLFGLLTSFGVARSGGDPAWGWMGFAFSLILNWGAALERRLKDRRAARPRPPPPLGWRRVPWYSWFFLACAAFPLLAVTAFLDERRLAREGVVTHAAVTDWREHPGRRGTTFEVRYAFRVSPGGEEFTASTSFPFPQRDLWVELPRDAW